MLVAAAAAAAVGVLVSAGSAVLVFVVKRRYGRAVAAQMQVYAPL